MIEEPVSKEYKTPFASFTVSFTYPKKNPVTAIDDITSALAHIGIMDGIKQ